MIYLRPYPTIHMFRTIVVGHRYLDVVLAFKNNIRTKNKFKILSSTMYRAFMFPFSGVLWNISIILHPSVCKCVCPAPGAVHMLMNTWFRNKTCLFWKFSLVYIDAKFSDFNSIQIQTKTIINIAVGYSGRQRNPPSMDIYGQLWVLTEQRVPPIHPR